MHQRLTRCLSLVSVLVLAIGCQTDRPLATDGDDLSFTARAALGSSSFLTATSVSPSEVNLSWPDNSTNESGFELQRSTFESGNSFLPLATTGPNVTSYRDAGLTPGTTYCYQVRAFRKAGRKTTYSDFSAMQCATTPAPPAAASNTDATPASSNAIRLAWRDMAFNEAGFRVERSASDGGPWELVTTTAAGVTSFSDGGRASEQAACYRVIAFNDYGVSAPSNVDCTTPPAGPTSLVASSGDEGVILVWLDNSAAEDSYEVQRSTDAVSFGSIAILSANATGYQDWPVGGGTHWYRVRARKDGGFSDPSNIASAAPPCAPSEVCSNGIDDDCDGAVDGLDGDCPGCWEGCPGGYFCNEYNECVSHCFDGARNGDETDVDCGGGCGESCQEGQSCNGNWDCASGSCVNWICQPAPPDNGGF